MYRDHTKVIHIGDRVIGGGNPILIQSMTNTKTEDVAATVAQIQKLTAAGCDIIRCAVPTNGSGSSHPRDQESRSRFPWWQISILTTGWPLQPWKTARTRSVSIPETSEAESGCSAVVDTAKERNIPIRVGVNSGSLEKDLVEKYHGVTAEGIVESALDKVHMIEEDGL